MGEQTFRILPLDILVFVVFVIAVVAVGLIKSRGEASSADYFLAGRGLRWWLIGFSLIAANISTEQFVGMSGNAASHVGLAIASYEWMAAITLVVVGFGFLPHFLRMGIYTMPEFLEHRFNAAARTIMAVATLCIYMLLLGAVTYSGALTISSLAAKADIAMSVATGAMLIGLVAMVYVTAGGLRACAWADLIQGSALILGGGVIMYFAFQKLGVAEQAATVVSAQTGAVEIRALSPDAGPVERFWDLNASRMNMFLPRNDAVLPWTALLMGLWIPNFYYWGLNQYITQRTLGSASLEQGQKGIVFAACLKLLIPFVIVVPGIIAFNLYSTDMRLEAVRDNAAVMARYRLTNPETKYVEITRSPTEEMVRDWQPGRYLVAVYPDDATIASLRLRNPWVLPISASRMNSLSPSPVGVFVSEDKSWAAVNEGLAQEIAEYNERVRAAARQAGQAVVVEKMTAYKYDTALAQLLGHVLPQGVGLVGFVFAALLGAVVSSLAAMLNAASTIFTMDIFKRYIARESAPRTQLLVGRIAVVVFAVVAVLLAPALGNPRISNSIFTIIQEGQGFISSGILAAFAFGILVRRAPSSCGMASLLTNIVAYGALKMAVPDLQFLNRMAVCFALCVAVMVVLTLVRPLDRPMEFRREGSVEVTTSKTAVMGGLVVIAATLLLYLVFSPVGVAR